MKKITLSNEYLSMFATQISLLLHAGISIGDGLQMLAEDETDADAKELLLSLGERVDDGVPIAEAMEQSGCFPDYVVHMTRTGEETGRTEKALEALAAHYERQRLLTERIQSALVYPLVLLILMLLIIGILLVRILPIFNTVYEQLGGTMTGMAAGLLHFGSALRAALPVLMAVAGILVAVALVLFFSDHLRARVVRMFKRRFGDRGLMRKVSMARFASSLSMGMRSGLAIEDAMQTAMGFHEESEKVKKSYETCLSAIEEGQPLGEALKTAEVFSPLYCRMISLGVRSGAGDEIMEEISQRMEDDANRAIDGVVARIEPTIVILTSIMVGVILLSVMIPLMNIMSTIG